MIGQAAAIRIKGLCDTGTIDPYVTKCPELLARILRVQCVREVFDDEQSLVLADSSQLFCVRGDAEQIGDQRSPGARRDRIGELGGIEAERFQLDIHEDRLEAQAMTTSIIGLMVIGGMSTSDPFSKP